MDQPAAGHATPASDAFAALQTMAVTAASGQPAAQGNEEPAGNMRAVDDPGADSVLAETGGPFTTSGRPASEHAITGPRAVPMVGGVAMPADPDAGFDDAFGSRIVWMAEQKLGHAELRVSPDGLGPIDVRLQMDGQRVTAQFTAAHPDVRQALEAGMGRLRDMLGQHGMELTDAHVGQHGRSSGDQGSQRGRGSDGMAADQAGDGSQAPLVTTIAALRARGLIDEYA